MSQEVKESLSDQAEIVEKSDEDSLDNFFKKKDKRGKKKKGKKSDKSGEEKDASKPKRKEQEPKKDQDNSKDDNNTAPKEQEEWIDYEDESQRDYSDLKIQNLQTPNAALEPQPAEAPEYDEAGELIPPKPAEGPWKSTAVQDRRVLHEDRKAAAAEPAKASKKVGAYRPPQARSTGSQSSSAAPLKRGRNQQAPEIHNELQFPSLADAAKDTANLQGFEVVKSGSKASTPWRSQHQQARASEIKLNNQFSALNTGC